MMIHILKIGKFLFLGFFVFFAINASAQLNYNDVTLILNPANPIPGQNATAKLSSYVVDLTKSNITWSLNNEIALSGIGKDTFSFTPNKQDAQTTINITIETITGQSIQKSLTFSNSEVDMLWEAADSYSPPFYKGKTLVSKEGLFKIVAIPAIGTGENKINPNNLSYTWEKNDTGQPNASGWGRTSFIFKNSYLDPTDEVKVKISDITGKTKIESTINVKPTDPKILFYKDDTKLGIDFNNILPNGYTLNKDGENIFASPFFLSPRNLESSNLKFTWTLGDRELPDWHKNTLNVKPTTGSFGSSKIKLFVTNVKQLFGDAEKELNVNF